MDFKFQYRAVIAKYGLKESELPKDAQKGIADINNILKAISMAEKKTKKISPETIEKVQRLDRWVAKEIIDWKLDTDDNDDSSGVKPNEVIEQINNEEVETIDALIDVELLKLYEANPSKEYSLEELRSSAPSAYKYIWDTYGAEDDENGISTSNFDVSENKETKRYLITKK